MLGANDQVAKNHDFVQELIHILDEDITNPIC